MKTFFDIGANDGSTCIPVATQKEEEWRVFAFEPCFQKALELIRKTVHMKLCHVYPVAVSDFDGTALFNVAGQEDWGCSSLLEFSEKSKTHWPGRCDFKVTESNYVPVLRLESFINKFQEFHITEIDFLHVDAQGSDLAVLKGLGEYIDMVKVGQVEAATVKDILYVGQNTLEETHLWLLNHGFKILDFKPNDLQGNEVNIRFTR